MVEFGVCAWIYGDAPLDGTLGRIAAAGYDGVELPGEPDRWAPEEVRGALSRHGLAPLALTASCMFPQTPRNDEWWWSVEGMRAAAVEAKRTGVRIAIEPLNRYEAYLVTNVRDALAYLVEVDSPWVGLTIDTFHASIEEPDIAGAIRSAQKHLFHFHLGDTNRQALGRGHLDLPSVMEALRATGYRGAAVLEVMPPGPDPFRSIKDDRSPQVLDKYLAESLARLRAYA